APPPTASQGRGPWRRRSSATVGKQRAWLCPLSVLDPDPSASPCHLESAENRLGEPAHMGKSNSGLLDDACSRSAAYVRFGHVTCVSTPIFKNRELSRTPSASYRACK